MLVHKYKLTCMNSFTDHRKSYKSYDGNYYTYPRREHQIKRFKKPSFIQLINRGSVFYDIILTTYIFLARDIMIIQHILFSDSEAIWNRYNY